LILGCTHYPLLRNLIQRVIGEEVELIDSGTAAAVVVEDYLRAGNLLNDSATEGNDLFFVSDMPAKFKLIAERFLGRKITNLQKIDLEEELKRS
jgi:glutamate racemase